MFVSHLVDLLDNVKSMFKVALEPASITCMELGLLMHLFKLLSFSMSLQFSCLVSKRQNPSKKTYLHKYNLNLTTYQFPSDVYLFFFFSIIKSFSFFLVKAWSSYCGWYKVGAVGNHQVIFMLTTYLIVWQPQYVAGIFTKNVYLFKHRKW